LHLQRNTNPARGVVAAVALVAFCGLAACSGIPATARYVGDSPQCEGGFGPSSTLVRTGAAFAYAPADGALVVHGALGADGSFAGSLDLKPASTGLDADVGGAPAKSPPRRTTLTLSVSGRMGPDTATVTYRAGACGGSVTLTRVHPELL
jgi:hypothetical protein